MTKDFDIDKYDDRQELAKDTPIQSISDIPAGLLDDTNATITIGNYIGWESDADNQVNLVPIIQALISYANLIASENQHNRLLALARPGALDRSPEHIRKALKPAVVQVDKKDGEYTLSKRQAFGLRRAINANKVIWGSPVQTTENNGLSMKVKTGLVRFARKYEANLSILGVELDPDALDQKIPRKLHMEQIEIPAIVYDPPQSDNNNDEIKLNKLANEAITIYALAYIASLLPENQRGQFEHNDPYIVMKKQVWQLVGMQVDGLYVTGGFLDKEINPATPESEVKSESLLQKVQHVFKKS